MKKIFYAAVVLFCICTTGVHAQLTKGNVLIGGDIANFDLALTHGSAFSMTLSPKAAWFIKDNFALGGLVDFGLATAKGAGTTVNYGIAPLARYYFPGATAMAGTSRFFAEANVGIEGVNTAGGGSTNGLGFGIGPGFAHFVTTNISLEALLKYTGIVGFGSTPTSSRLQLGFGFQIYLPGSAIRAEARRVENR